MKEFTTFILTKLDNHWHKVYTPVLLTCTLIVPGLISVSDKPLWCQILLVASTPLIVFALWYITNRLPMVKKGKIGIVLAFSSDSQEEANQLEIDFIKYLKTLLQRDPDGANFEVVVLPDFATNQLETFQGCDMVLRRCRGHLLLYGSAKKRNVRGKETHIIDFDGFVRHAPIPKEIRNKFAMDFSSAIPKRVMFSTENDALDFESTSKWFDISARYVVGVAAFLSGAVGYSEQMLLKVETDLKNSHELPPFSQSIAMKLPTRLIELYTNWIQAVHNEYYTTGNEVFLQIEDELTGKLLIRDPHQYGALLGKSIAEFVLRRNISKAKELLSRCKNTTDATWRYNLAFLYCYEGNLNAANEEYRTAFKKFTNNVTVPIQCEEFIHNVLVKEPDKQQLYFALGLINYSAKKDYDSAKHDFEVFLESEWAVKNPLEKELCLKLIKRCEHR